MSRHIANALARMRRFEPILAYAVADEDLRAVPEIVADNYAGEACLRNAIGMADFHDEARHDEARRTEEHTSELQTLMRISYAVLSLKTHKIRIRHITITLKVQKYLKR